MFPDLEVTPAEVVARKESGPLPLLVDVREDWEWEYNRIPDAIHIPLSEIEFRHAELDKGVEIILYCHHGMRSLQAAIWLRQEGYEKARSLAGGIDRWADDVEPEMPRY